MNNKWTWVLGLGALIFSCWNFNQYYFLQKERITFAEIQAGILERELNHLKMNALISINGLKKKSRQIGDYKLHEKLFDRAEKLIYPQLPESLPSIQTLQLTVDSIEKLLVIYDPLLAKTEIPYSNRVKAKFPLFYALNHIEHLSVHYKIQDFDSLLSSLKLMATHDTTQNIIQVKSFRKWNTLTLATVRINNSSYPINAYGLIYYKRRYTNKGIYPLELNWEIENPITKDIINYKDTFNLVIK